MNDARPMLPSAAGEPFGLGARAMRREDLPLVTGVGQFVADTVLPGEVHAVFVRSVPPYQVTLHEVPTATNPLGTFT